MSDRYASALYDLAVESKTVEAIKTGGDEDILNRSMNNFDRFIDNIETVILIIENLVDGDEEKSLKKIKKYSKFINKSTGEIVASYSKLTDDVKEKKNEYLDTEIDKLNCNK